MGAGFGLVKKKVKGIKSKNKFKKKPGSDW